MAVETDPLFFLSAGEASGDIHAANLMVALRRRIPEARFVGVGGPQMAAAGCEMLEEIASRSTMMLDAVAKARHYVGLLCRVRHEMAQRRPSMFIPVDSPALNWHFCRAARRAEVGILHYVCPQTWAWGGWRINKLRRLTDHVACLLPFEPAYLAEHGIAGTFVGHPILDELPRWDEPRPEPPTDGAWRILLLPGSRTNELERHSAALAQAAELIRQSYPHAQLVFSAHSTKDASKIEALAGADIPIEVGLTRELMKSCHVALAASGTVTLEAAGFGLPMVVFYYVSRTSYHLLRWVMKTKYFSLVNILAGRELVRELMPWHGQPDILAREMLNLMADRGHLQRLPNELRALVNPLRMPLGKPAADATAELIEKKLHGELP